MNALGHFTCLMAATVFFIVALLMISWASNGFAVSPEFNRGYNAGVNELNQFNSVGHSFECPLANPTGSPLMHRFVYINKL